MLLNNIAHRFSVPNCLRVINVSSKRQVNFKSRNPPDPHFDRKRMLEVCKPIFVPKKLPEWQTCNKSAVLSEVKAHPYEMLLAKDMKKSWDDSKMIMFYHVTSLSDRTKREIRNTFFKNDLFFHTYSTEVVKLAVEGTPFTSILHLFESHTALLFCPEINIDKVLQLSKKLNQVILMAGIVENVFYSRNQLQQLNTTLKKDGYQELAQFLDYFPSKVVETINQPQHLLSHYLNELSNNKE